MSSRVEAGLEASERVMNAARAEVMARKARKKSTKTNCGRCGRGATRSKLQTCSRCKAVNYCSAACQREHWKAGHKQECNGFVHPPFSKHFDAADREDVPWPVDPIFASSHVQGVGVWTTSHGSLSTLLQQAFEPIEPPTVPAPPQGPPSYQRWAGMEGPNKRDYGPEMIKYVGSTLMGLRVVVQNRRQDGRIVAIFPAETELTTQAKLKANLLPEDLKAAKFTVLPDDRQRVMTIRPWKDYTGLIRVGILELNGVSAPKGRFKGNEVHPGEYEPPAKPAGQPWDRVIDWTAASLMLGPGDYAVFVCQYRIGDGKEWKSYPELLTHCLGLTLQACLTAVTTSDANWCDSVRRDVRLLRASKEKDVSFEITAPFDYAYFEEYFRPYFEQDSDVFAASRYGQRAEQANELTKTFGAMALNMLMHSMTPENRAEAARRFQAMGFDIEEALRQNPM